MNICLAIIHCEFAGAGNVASISVNFQDQGMCMSTYYESTHYLTDGSSVYTPYPNANEQGAWGKLDFSTWDCCKPA